jgi:hypothetical protein
VPDGTIIEARIGEETFIAATEGEIYGESTYAVIVEAPEGVVYSDDTPVYFRIGDRDAIQYGLYKTGGNVPLDITDRCTRETTSVTYVSDSNDTVALSYDGATYRASKRAVPTWVFPAYPAIEGATWISSSYVVEDGHKDSWRRFEKRFSFPVPWDATRVSGTLEIAADNSYTVYFNGIEVGSDADVMSIETWQLDLNTTSGENEITIVVWNRALGPRVIAANPTGVIYRLTASYDSPPGPTATPTPAPVSTPVPAPTETPAIVPSPTQAPGPPPTTQPTYAPVPTPAQDDSVNLNKIMGIAFFGFVDILLIGLFVYLIWRFFIHPRSQMS